MNNHLSKVPHDPGRRDQMRAKRDASASVKDGLGNPVTLADTIRIFEELLYRGLTFSNEQDIERLLPALKELHSR